MYMKVITCTSTFALNFDTCSWSGCGDGGGGGGGGGRQVGDVPPQIINAQTATVLTLLCTHGHPSLHSWSPFSALMVTLLCTHGHPSLHSWSPFSALMVTLLCTHGHPSLHSWSPFFALMVTLLCTHGHPYLHSCSPFSVTQWRIQGGCSGCLSTPSAIGANIIKHYTLLIISRKTSKGNNE